MAYVEGRTIHDADSHIMETPNWLDPSWFENGLPPIPDFHGGDENFRSVDYMAIPGPPAQTLAALIFDRVLDRWPRLKFGVIEQGASWVPGWMRMMDSAVTAFSRMEERLRKLSALPSEIVRRQVRVTPYPSEDVGWIVSQAGEEIEVAPSGKHTRIIIRVCSLGQSTRSPAFASTRRGGPSRVGDLQPTVRDLACPTLSP